MLLILELFLFDNFWGILFEKQWANIYYIYNILEY